MAIRIPILTSFDSKGIKLAQSQINKVRGNIQNLGRNFAIAGAAVAAFGGIIAKATTDLARIEAINAQTAQTIKSMGNSAKISATEVEGLASRLEKLTATEAETIQEGANLLLTFGNIRNELGAGNDIFTRTTEIMVDMARVLKTGPQQEAIRLGKALNDPITGMTALRKAGVSFSDQQKEQVKVLQQSGDLMGAQKLILDELQRQFGGSGAAYAKTFTGQLELLNHELGAMGEEAALSVMPAIQGLVTELREVVPIIGAQLKGAIESIDFKALAKSFADLITFVATNAETIGRLVTALFILNTAFNLGRVAVGLYSAGVVITTGLFGATTTAAGIATVALNLFRIALLLTGVGAVVVILGTIITAIMGINSAAADGKPKLDDFNESVRKSGIDADVASTRYGGLITKIRDYNAAVAGMPTPRGGGGGGGYGSKVVPDTPEFEMPDISSITGGAGGTKKLTLGQTLKREATVVKKQAKLIGAGVSEGLAARLTSGAAPVKRANKALANIAKNNGKLTKNLKKMEKNLRASSKVATESVSESVEAIQDTSVQDALDAKERAYQSFADSVKSTFSSIKDSILGAFDLTQLGGSTNAITRNMDKLLVRLRSFATNISKLSGMGLNATLLQQVIQAGPLAGARLAESLVAGGAGALSAINAGYTEFGMLAGQIATTGTNALFGTQAQQSVYNINVDGGVGSGATIGKAIVDAIKAYERTSGAVWQGA
jgi:hypothetical protein